MKSLAHERRLHEAIRQYGKAETRRLSKRYPKAAKMDVRLMAGQTALTHFFPLLDEITSGQYNINFQDK